MSCYSGIDGTIVSRIPQDVEAGHMDTDITCSNTASERSATAAPPRAGSCSGYPARKNILSYLKIFCLQKNIWSARRRHLKGGREEAVLVDGEGRPVVEVVYEGEPVCADCTVLYC